MIKSDTYSAILSVKWDWSENALSGRESEMQEAYKYDTITYNRMGGNEEAYPLAVVDTRIRVRGSGRVMSVRYESQTGKDFQLIGHATPFTVETEG